MRAVMLHAPSVFLLGKELRFPWIGLRVGSGSGLNAVTARKILYDAVMKKVFTQHLNSWNLY
jgi:hypothetical protein